MMSQQQFKAKRDAIIKKYDDVKSDLIDEANQEYTRTKGRIGGELISEAQYEEIMLQINYDIAWQIFDDVNVMNDTAVLVDLNCLDTMDAQAVTKQKIYDLSQLILLECQVHNINGLNDHVLCVVCTDEHFYRQINDNQTAPLKNGILEMIRNEL